MIRVCLDTNILISGIIFGGKPKEILDLSDQVIFITSTQILTELTRVLRNKFDWSESEIKQALKTLGHIQIIASPRKKVSKIKYNPDNRILECALEGQADYIVSGDKKHLLPLKKFEGIKIVSTTEFLKSI